MPRQAILMSSEQEPVMNSFYDHHKDSIRFNYRCFDRILLNGIIQPFQQPERVVGFFNTYRQLYPVTRDVLRDISTQFHNWAKNRSQHWDVPLIDDPGTRRDKFVAMPSVNLSTSRISTFPSSTKPCRPSWVSTRMITPRDGRRRLLPLMATCL